ncbi:thioredoxin [Persicitalea sp.]|uniref:thioredoxin n=1 Tax=Persicitalea sp. TaxID=3100273 RepID=UPI00359313E1
MNETMGNFKEIIKSEQPVLVDFFAEWCGPCKMMKPVLEEVAKKLDGKARILKVDIDKNRKAANQYRIQGVPTLILFQGGQIKWRQSGYMDAKKLNSVLEKYVK